MLTAGVDRASEHVCSGKILQLERPTRLVMTWEWVIDFYATLLPSQEAARDHERGWNGAFDKLERQLNY